MYFYRSWWDEEGKKKQAKEQDVLYTVTPKSSSYFKCLTTPQKEQLSTAFSARVNGQSRSYIITKMSSWPLRVSKWSCCIHLPDAVSIQTTIILPDCGAHFTHDFIFLLAFVAARLCLLTQFALMSLDMSLTVTWTDVICRTPLDNTSSTMFHGSVSFAAPWKCETLSVLNRRITLLYMLVSTVLQIKTYYLCLFKSYSKRPAARQQLITNIHLNYSYL